MQPPAPPSDLRPLTLGELIDRSAVFWRANVRRLFMPLLAYQLIAFTLLKLYEAGSRRWFPLLRSGPELQRLVNSEPMLALEQLSLAGLAGCTLAGIYFWMSWLISVGGTRFVVDSMLGRQPSIEDGARRLSQRLWDTSVAYVLSILWGLAVGVLCMLPGVVVMLAGVLVAQRSTLGVALAVGGVLLSGLGALVAILWYVVRFTLTAQVLAMEEGGPLHALKRSGELVSGRIGLGFVNLVKVRATILITATAAITAAVSLVASVPVLVLQQVYGHAFEPGKANPDAVPQALLIPAQLFQMATQVSLMPFTIAFGALFYLDMRMRREGLDIELKLGLPPP